ncbi:site-specific DNA-methyltransferase [Patescibacteria group bacterium]|nr:site-specific DNA-methyltransferase [Patescibacteria group bacterium]
MPRKNNKQEIIISDPTQQVEIPQQSDFYKSPARFGAVPVDEAPLGWVVETRRRETKITKFENAYPRIYLPFQEVHRLEFGHGEEFEKTELFPTGANRLFFGDNLHVMRQLPSKSIDLFYLDPPFFSGRNYNVIFGDKNEVRSFSDIWEGGMPGYLIWLNVRLYEMKRLLKDTGSIYVHLDWHASHYVKVEMDKIFGYDNLIAEIIWNYGTASGGRAAGNKHVKSHDTILVYSKAYGNHIYNKQFTTYSEKYIRERFIYKDEDGRIYRTRKRESGKITKQYLDESPGVPLSTVWNDITQIYGMHLVKRKNEEIGYPTQKPESLLERIIQVSSNENDIVADLFCGGGTTPAVAQKLNRRWIACDQSRIAVSVTADRIAKLVEEEIGKLFVVPDFTVEHWGVYETPRLEKLSLNKFREFVIRCFGGKPETVSENIHGIRHGVPLFVGDPSRRSRITKEDVARFAKAVFNERGDNFGTMLAWNFGPDAKKAAEILAARENKRIDFVRLSLIRLEDEEFRGHITNKHKDYSELLTFIQPPEVRLTYTRIGKNTYRFDVSESVSLNKDGVIANVQWDFDYRDNRFSSTRGYSFLRDRSTGKPLLIVEYEFPSSGKKKCACSVQDDQGGERTVPFEIDVS